MDADSLDGYGGSKSGNTVFDPYVKTYKENARGIRTRIVKNGLQIGKQDCLRLPASSSSSSSLSSSFTSS
jgi:hypothetical protein